MTKKSNKVIKEVVEVNSEVVQSESVKVTSAKEETREELVARLRKRRVPLHERGPLYIDPKYKRPGFVYRWVKDLEGNLEKFMNDGYEPVKRKVEVGDSKVAISHKLGSVVTAPSGGGILLVLCEIPVEIHKEIQAEKEQVNTENDKALGKTGIPTQIGEIQIGKDTYK